MGFFIRPKDTNRADDSNTSKLNAEAVGVVSSYEDEYIPTSGFDSEDNTSGSIHRRDPKRREAAPNAPLPSGGWRGATTRNVSSGFGKGTRAGKSGVRRG